MYIIVNLNIYNESAFLFLNIIQIFQLSKLLDALYFFSDVTLCKH